MLRSYDVIQPNVIFILEDKHLLFFILYGYFRMTDEERNELEKQVKTLQEGYNLLFSECLKQLEESQTSGDTNVEEKVMLSIEHKAVPRNLGVIV